MGSYVEHGPIILKTCMFKWWPVVPSVYLETIFPYQVRHGGGEVK